MGSLLAIVCVYFDCNVDERTTIVPEHVRVARRKARLAADLSLDLKVIEHGFSI